MNHIIWKKISLKSIFKIEKCTGIKISNLIEGEIPYVSRSSINNGITRFCGNKDYINPKNTITIHAEWKENYCAFYQEEDYVTDGMIAFLSCEELNKYNGLFITTILSKTKYSGDGLKKSLNDLSIKLPVLYDGRPNWEYMSNEIKQLENEIKQSLYNIIPKLNDINTTTWKEFKVSAILKREKIKSISSKIKKFDMGKVCVIGNSSLNNGIVKMLDIRDYNYIHKSNTLSYGAKGGKFFYQLYPWASTDHVHMFASKKLNAYNSLFLCTILNKIIETKGGWSSSLESNIINESIKLPITKNNQPDWEYMEKYIKSTIR